MSKPTGRNGRRGILAAQTGRPNDRRSATHVASDPAVETLAMSHEHDTVVVDDRDSGSGMGAILGILAIVVLLAAVWFFALGPGAGSSGTTNNNTINNGGNPPAATQQPASS